MGAGVCCTDSRYLEKLEMKKISQPLERDLVARKQAKNKLMEQLIDDNQYESDCEDYSHNDDFIGQMQSELKNTAKANRLGKTIFDLSMLASGMRKKHESSSDGICLAVDKLDSFEDRLSTIEEEENIGEMINN